MNDLSTERWRRVFAAADEFADLDEKEQIAFLAQCALDDPELLIELKTLLAAADSSSPLDSSAAQFAAPLFERGPSENGARKHPRFGAYRLLRELGRGGMGAVYLAERSDDQYRKRVALKILTPWSASDDRRIQRFIEERQILAALDHPDIARLLDGGVTDDGLPWFAMELVEGVRIDTYCDELRLPIAARLELFCEVCAAVQYAHRNLVVHRDLKPANILVTADRRVRLLDFGIAKLLGDESARDLTVTTDRMLTPTYASPEQIRGGAISTLTDVYSLGVLLNVLLTGRYPYRLSTWEHHDIVRAVLEEDPSSPSSTILRATGFANREDNAESVAIARQSTVPRLHRELAGDLDAIVLKAIEKNPGSRYSSAEQLESDVRRYLAGQPVLAQPVSRLYHARKFVRRHRAGVAAAFAAVFLVTSFGIVATVQALRIRAQTERMTRVLARSEQVGAYFLKTIRSVAPGDRGVSARELLDSAAASIDLQLPGQPGARASLMVEMASAYHRIELHDRARALLEKALALRLALEPRVDVGIAETHWLLGVVLLAQGHAVDAEQSFNEALVIQRNAGDAQQRDVARTLVGLSDALRVQQRLTEAERAARQARRIDSLSGGNAADLAQSTSALARVLTQKQAHIEAVGLFRLSLALQREAYNEEHANVAIAIFDLADALHKAGIRGEADSLIRYGIVLQRHLLDGAQLSGQAPRLGSASSSPAAAATSPAKIGAPLAQAFAKPPAPLYPASVVSPRSPRIVFVSDRDGPDPVGDNGNHEIYVMNADGTDAQRLTHEKSDDFNPEFSPDGKMIAFSSQRGGGVDVYLMNADGTNQRRLTNLTEAGIGALEPTWSPDGKRIAFRTRFKHVDIYVINLDGTGLTRLTNDPGGALAPSWSPDGKQIAFTSRRHGAPEILVMDADGSNVKRLTTNEFIDNRATWSPDGRRIAFHSNRDGNEEIYVMNADGSNQIRLTTYAGDDSYPAWSHDGRQLVFHRRVLGHAQLFVMNADGSDPKRITELSATAFNAFARWGPSSR